MRHLTALLVALAPAAAAADFHVAPAGNDANPGTAAAPFATPARAVRAAGRGATVVLHGGRYELAEPLTVTSGLITFAAAPGETPILSGGRAVTPKVEGGLWVVPVPDAKTLIRHVSVGGQMRLAARWPKEGTFPIAGLAGADPKANYRTPADKFEYAAGQLDAAQPGFTDAEVVVLHFWVAGHYRVKAIDAATRTVTLDRKSIRRFTEDGGGKQPGRFYLLNAPGEPAPGEFVHDRAAGVLRYKPKPGEAPGPVVVPRLAQVVEVRGEPEKGRFVEKVEFHGVTFADTTFDPGTTAAGDLQAAQNVPGSVRFRGAKQCRIVRSRFVNLGGYGLELGDGCRGNRVSRNEFADLAAGGIRMSGGAAGSPVALRTGDNEVFDNHLHDLGRVWHAGVGILSQHADLTRISHNHIHHLDYTAISVGWVWGYGPSVSEMNLVEDNLIHDVGRKVLSDMGGIYLLGPAPGTVVRRNVIRDVESFGYGGWGIYTDEGSTGVLIEKNLVYRTKSGGFHQHYGKDNVIRNNIFALAREGQLMRTCAEPHRSFMLDRNIIYADGSPLFAKNWTGTGFEADRNLYWDARNKAPAFPGGTFADWQKAGRDANGLVADPLFIDPANGDFRFRPGTPSERIGFVPFDPSTAGVQK